MSGPHVEFVSPAPDVVVARLLDEVDISNTAIIEDAVLRAVSSDSLGVVFDLSVLRYMDSAGVRMVFEIARRLESRRQGIGLAVPEDSHLRKLLKITRAEEVVILGASVEECIGSLRQKYQGQTPLG